MTDENTDDLCKDCDPTLKAFLKEMAAHNKEQLTQTNAKVICPTCGKVHEYTFPDASKTPDPPASNR